MEFMKRKKAGFTLAELLVVVAIIAILVAVSIPIFSGKLDKAREATDLANIRAAKAAATMQYLNNDVTLTNDGWYCCYYDAENGKVWPYETPGNVIGGIKGYNKLVVGGYETGTKIQRDKGILFITMKEDGETFRYNCNWYDPLINQQQSLIGIPTQCLKYKLKI